MRKSEFGWWRQACVVFVLSAATAIAAHAQTVTTLAVFDGTNGAEPEFMSLIQGADGNLYGTTSNGGPFGGAGCGTAFRMTSSGALTTFYNFECQTDGGYPHAGFVLGTDGKLYGTTSQWGTGGAGTVFKVTAAGTLTTLFSFSDSQGFLATGALIQATDGNFYGATEGGGFAGALFKVTPAGAYRPLYLFCKQFGCLDGGNPYGPLVQGSDGNFYGTTLDGGANHLSGERGYGTVFKITSTGTLTTLHSFDVTDGQSPQGGLALGADGNFYGTTVGGGANGLGTVFKITPAGTLSTLHSFDGTDGSGPNAPLIQATDGNFYGTTAFGGDPSCSPNGCGTIFKISPSGVFTTLYNFTSAGGFDPTGGLFQATNGTLYGATIVGGGSPGCFLGTLGCGTIYSLAVGLGPFVETVPAFGSVGAPVKILGNNLTGTTSVTFNGVPATFNVVSSTLISTSVPSGATTGRIQVTTPSGTLRSNLRFQVQ
jgi:uncharacterized repeat protein (TIGR03803 family)